MIEPRTLKGFADFGRKESVARDMVFSKIKNVFTRFGFLPLETPTLEYRDILLNKYGEDEKLVYAFKDHGDRDVAMRYDLTVPMARYVAQNLNTITLPFKRYQIQPVWRADNTQRGRSREFYQCDIDIVGSTSPLCEIEVVSCLLAAFSEIGLSTTVARFSDRRLLDGFVQKLSGGSHMVVQLMRVIDKVYKKSDQDLISEAQEKYAFTTQDVKVLVDVLEFIRSKKPVSDITSIVEVKEEVMQSLSTIFSGLEAVGMKDRVVFDLGITRGFDYYSSSVWEFFDPENDLALGSGGRYDGLVSSFANKELPAVGGSLGITRILELAKQTTVFVNPVKCIVFNIEKEYSDEYANLARQLRDAGVPTEVYLEAEKIEKQFKYAEKLEIPFAVIVGKKEKEKNIVQVKNLQTRTQTEIAIEELAQFLKNG